MSHLVLSASFLIPNDENDYFEGSIKHIVKIGKVKAVSRQSDTQKTVKIHLGDVEMKLEPDSGADVNLMDEFHFTRIFSEVVFNSFSHIPSISPRNHTSFILLIILFVSCSTP
jgi:hypothetical protein